MIRTYSLIRALQLDWKIHFLALRDTAELRMEPGIANLNIEKFDSQAAGNFVGHLRKTPYRRVLLELRNKLKSKPGLFFLANLPFELCYELERRRKISRVISSRPFDAVLLDYTKLAHHAALFGNGKIKKILNMHNAESDVARQSMRRGKGLAKLVHGLRWKIYERYERKFLPKYELLLASSEADADFYRRLAPNIKTIVVPNAVDTDALTLLGTPEEPFSLIYPGRMDYAPNAEAVEIFCRQILPRIAQELPAARFSIVGKNPPRAVRELDSERVVVTGYVEDVLPYWRKAAALVVPLSIGGGTRIKILEAMALGRPVISTSKGCEGLEVIHEQHLLIADDSERFAEHVIRVLKNPEEYFEMSRAARKLVEEKYSFAAIGSLLLRTLKDTVSEP
jgi:glycosyltransferase involved in cell wall biosynthesis